MRFQALAMAVLCAAAPMGAAAGGADAAAPSDQAPAAPNSRSTTVTTTTEKQQYEQGTQRRLNRLERDTARLQRDAGTAANRSLRVAAANLATGVKAAEAKLAALKRAAAPAWQRLRANLDHSLMLLDQKVRELDTKLRSRNARAG